MAQDADYGRLRRYVRNHEKAIVERLMAFLSIPNVAVDLPNMRRNAEQVERMLRLRGAETRLLQTGGPPLVYGEIRSPASTVTVLFYAHYDGQPADPSRWVGHEPWEPILRAGPLESHPEPIPIPPTGEAIDRNWRVYARSASDDKAPIVALMTALDGLRDQELRPTANLKFLFDGEEEAGSPHLAAAMRTHRSLLAADVAIFADGPVHPSNAPTLALGVRGIVTVELTVYGPRRPLHSGHYGNWAPNPAERLAELLASMQDDSGRVTIEGWYDDVRPLSAADRAALAHLPDDPAELDALGVPEPEGDGRSRWEMVTLPSFNVRGLRSGWVGGEARTIVPDRAVASLDFRLVRDVRPEAQVARFLRHLRRRGYHVIEEEPDEAARRAHPRLARVTVSDGYPAARTPADDPLARALLAELRRATGRETVVVPTLGGSVPAYLFPELLGATFLGLPIVNPDNNQHSPNENLRLGNLFDGIVSLAGAMRAGWEEVVGSGQGVRVGP
ncbi:MAG: M20/M25/M40 family metallo-hydrolase [Gemmatimonadota bacterium]